MKQRTFLPALALSLALAFQSHAAEIMEIEGASDQVRNAFVENCVSYKEKDVINCVKTTIFQTAQLTKAFENKLPDAPLTAVHRNCTENFNNINQASLDGDYINNTPLFVQDGFLASRLCVQTIEVEGKKNGVDFLPSVRREIERVISNAEKGVIDFSLII